MKVLFFFFLTNVAAYAQGYIGLFGSYNNAIKNPGVGFRVGKSLNEKMDLLANVKYFPGLNTIQELNASLGAQYYALGKTQILNPYIITEVSLNYWMNYIVSSSPRAKEINILPFVGAGVDIPVKAIRIFTEFRYSPILNESTTEAGLRFGFAKKKGELKCPKII